MLKLTFFFLQAIPKQSGYKLCLVDGLRGSSDVAHGSAHVAVAANHVHGHVPSEQRRRKGH